MNARSWFGSTLLIGVAAAGLFAAGCSSEAPKTGGGDSAASSAKKEDAKSEAGEKKGGDAAAADLAGLDKWKGKENPVKNDAEALKKGKAVYAKNCASCHGDTGKGDGAAGEALEPKPRNFTKGEFKYGGEDWALMRTIMEGAPGAGNGMAPWDGRMEEKDGWAVVHYVKSLKK